MSLAECKETIAALSAEERREIAALIERLSRAENSESQSPAQRPEGYFASDYENPDPERLRFESAMAKNPQRPER